MSSSQLQRCSLVHACYIPPACSLRHELRSAYYYRRCCKTFSERLVPRPSDQCVYLIISRLREGGDVHGLSQAHHSVRPLVRYIIGEWKYSVIILYWKNGLVAHQGRAVVKKCTALIECGRYLARRTLFPCRLLCLGAAEQQWSRTTRKLSVWLILWNKTKADRNARADVRASKDHTSIGYSGYVHISHVLDQTISKTICFRNQVPKDIYSKCRGHLSIY